jgi:large conductance mechanosensitive channel
MLKEFREFIARGSVIDLAVAVILGVAFGKIITSLVEGIIMPPIGLLLGKVDFASLFYVLNHGKGDPVSLADAKAKGIPVIAYGAFINDLINFVIIAFVIFLIVKAMNSRKAKEEANTKDCPYCLTGIPLVATRCSGCCAELKAA